MSELPEAVVIADSINATVVGKRIARAVANAAPHRFAWYAGDPAAYNDHLVTRTIGRATGVGATIEIEVADRLLATGEAIRAPCDNEKGWGGRSAAPHMFDVMGLQEALSLSEPS